ncbi:MAG: insulinase family protein [Bacteroidetes bacterium]|nr:insulinase family protein [Bacteroidota bacterium]
MIEFEQFRLANGLNVVVAESKKAPLVAFDLLYHVGSKNEKWGRTGFAHLFEHLMFEGSVHAPGKLFDELLQNAGGENNAYTTEDLTNYYELIPSHEVELAFWLESDRMRFLNIDQDSFENQRLVVIEERRQRVDNQPYGTAMERLASMIFDKHPYRWPVIGYVDHLMDSTLDDVSVFYQKFYSPDNATLILSGDISLNQAQDLSETYFGEFKSSGGIARDFEFDQVLTSEKRETVYDSVQLPAFFMGFPTVSETHPDYFALDLMADILSNGKSSRLYQDLVYSRRIAQSVSAFQEQNEHPGIFGMYGIARPGADLRTLEDFTFSHIQKIADTGVTESELEKVKNLSISSVINRMQGVANIADFMSRYAGLYQNPGYVNELIQKVDSVTSEDIKRVANTWFSQTNRAVLHYLPKVTS